MHVWQAPLVAAVTVADGARFEAQVSEAHSLLIGHRHRYDFSNELTQMLKDLYALKK